MKDSGITLGQILDLIDNSRESEEIVEIGDNNGQVQCQAMVCSVIWKGIEDKTVNSMQAVGDHLKIWLNDEVINALKQEPKSEWEHDHEILKAYSDGASDILDKIVEEINEYKSRQLTLAIGVDDLEKGKQIAIEYVLGILDKYKEESENETSYTPKEVRNILIEEGQNHGTKYGFKLGDTIKFSPTEVEKILKAESEVPDAENN